MVFAIQSIHRYHSTQNKGFTCCFDVTVKNDEQYLTYKLSPSIYGKVVMGKYRIGDKVTMRDGDEGVLIEDECSEIDKGAVVERYLVRAEKNGEEKGDMPEKMNYLPFLSDTPLFFKTIPQRLETIYKNGCLYLNGKIKYEILKNEQRKKKRTSFEPGKYHLGITSSPTRGVEASSQSVSPFFVAKIIFKSRIIAYKHISFPFYQILVVLDLIEDKLVTVVLWNRSVYKYCNLQRNDTVVIPRCRKKNRYYNNGVMVYNSYSDVWMFDCEEFSVNGRDEVYICDIRGVNDEDSADGSDKEGIKRTDKEKPRAEDVNDAKTITEVNDKGVNVSLNGDNRTEEKMKSMGKKHSKEKASKRIKTDEKSALPLDAFVKVQLSRSLFDTPTMSFPFLHLIEGRINYISILLRKRKSEGTYFLINDKIEEFYLIRIGEAIIYLFNTSEEVFYELDARDYVILENMRIIDTNVYVSTVFTTITKKKHTIGDGNSDTNPVSGGPSASKRNLKAVEIKKKVEGAFISGAIGYHNLEVRSTEEIKINGCLLNVEIVPFINIVEVELQKIKELCDSLVINEMKRIKTRGYYLGMDEGITVGYYEINDVYSNASNSVQGAEMDANGRNVEKLGREQKGKYVLIGNNENIGDMMVEMDIFDNLLVNEKSDYELERKKIYTISAVLLRVDENNVLKIIGRIE